MKCSSIILLLFPLLTGGCSILIEESGYALQQLETREAVRSSFGEPVKRGIVKETVEHPDTYPIVYDHLDDLIGMEFDEFVTHRKIAHDAAPLGMGIAMTYGLGEFFCFPFSVYDASSNVLFGYRLRFVYDSQGKVKRVFENGEWYRGPERNGKTMTERKESIPGIR